MKHGFFTRSCIMMGKSQKFEDTLKNLRKLKLGEVTNLNLDQNRRKRDEDIQISPPPRPPKQHSPLVGFSNEPSRKLLRYSSTSSLSGVRSQSTPLSSTSKSSRGRIDTGSLVHFLSIGTQSTGCTKANSLGNFNSQDTCLMRFTT